MIIARGVAQIVNGNMNTNGIYSDAFKNFFYYGRFLGIYTPIWIAIVLFAFFAFILSKTALGRHVYALGSNYEAARLSGVNESLCHFFFPRRRCRPDTHRAERHGQHGRGL